MNIDRNPSPRLELFQPLCRLARLFLAFGMFLFALSAQADWGGTPKYPVIFIHGINSNAQDTWGDFVTKAPGNGWTYGGTFGHEPKVGGLLTYSDPKTPFTDPAFIPLGTNFPVPADFYTLTFSDPQGLTFSQQGAELADVISAVLAANPGKNKVILVAHSMGGLAARAYMQSHADRDDVDALITVGTPHLGSWAMEYCTLPTRPCAWAAGLKSESAAVRALRPDSGAFYNDSPPYGLNSVMSLSRGVSRYVSIVVTGKNTLSSKTFDAYGPGDGVVTESSQNFDSVALFHTGGAPHLVVPIVLTNGGPGCSSLANWPQVHTCEPHDLLVQNVIVQSILGKFDISINDFLATAAILDTANPLVVAANSTSPVKVMLQGYLYHPNGFATPRFLYDTTLLGLQNSFGIAQQSAVAQTISADKSSPAPGSSQLAQRNSTTPLGVQEFSAVLPGTLVPGQTYYYQFVADADGYTSYGQVHQVTIPPAAGIGALLPAPSGLLPASGAIDLPLRPTLSWNAVAGAASYRFMLAQNADALPIDPTDGNCDRCLVDTVVPTALGISYQPNAGVLNAGTTYYWQVHARGADNFGAWRSVDGSGVYVDAASFTTAMPTPATLLAAPIQTAPDDGSANLTTTPTLSWTPSSGAASYRIMIATSAGVLTADPTSADCAACVVNAIVSGGSSSSYVPDLGILAPNTTYYWRIKARSENYYGAWSPVCSFSTGAQATVGTVTEFDAGSVPWANPQGITAGPDGNLWFTQTYPDFIGAVTPAGVATGVGTGLAAYSYAQCITTGPDGNLWFGESGNRIGRITTAGVVTGFSAGPTPGYLPLPYSGSITTGPDGNLWFTKYQASQIGRITPTGVVTEFSASATPDSTPIAITAGSDGNLWYTFYNGSNRIGRITPDGVVTEFSAGITAGASPLGITNGPDGNLWFTEFSVGRIGRITPDGVVTEFGDGALGNVAAITTGPDGNLWFTRFGGNQIGRITPTGVVTNFTVGGSFGNNPCAITTGPDGNIWFTEYYGHKIGRIAFGPGTTSYTLNVSSVNGTVTSAPAGINCGATCSAGFSLGTSVTLTATPNAGSNFNGWSGAGCSGTGTCQMTMNGATTVNATFSPVTIPNPPTVTGITLGQGNVVLTFIAPPNNGGSTITGYTATCTTPGGSTGTMTGTGSPLTVSGLTVGLGYSCTMAANNGVGTSASTTALAYPPPASQSISFGAAPTVVVGGTGTISATGGASGNAVTFSSTTTGVCTVSGTTVTGVSAGACTIAANQAGNGSYAAAPQVTQNITVAAVTFPGNRSNYSIAKTPGGFTVTDKVGAGGAVALTGATQIKFADMTVNLLIGDLSKTIPADSLKTLIELYVAFFNRIPDSDGLAYWIGQYKSGSSINQIAESFYQAGIQYSSLTGFSAGMSNDDFINTVYRNVLGRPDGADADGLAYWRGKLLDGSATHGSLVTDILYAAHTYKTDPTYHGVADLLDNKYSVATFFCLQQGLNYNTPEIAIAEGMAIAAAVTPTDTAAAIALIMVSDPGFDLTGP